MSPQIIAMYHKALKNREKLFAVAPMIDWTDRHCRFFHRQMTRHALLYTEMVVADAILHGDRGRLLDDDTPGPVALQLGGSDPDKLAKAVELAAPWPYCEINLNVGCPSDRVQSGTFGACLMRDPALVGRCIAAMKSATTLPVTVKCRLGVDDQDIGPALDALAEAVWEAGADGVWVHARKAWLEGLSPKQNREVPPLDYGRVYRLKRENPSRFIGLNGGLESLNHALGAIEGDDVVLDAVMLGRAAYQTPGILRDADRLFFGDARPPVNWEGLVEAMADHAAAHIQSGGRLHHVTRHMTGLFHGFAGARAWRQILSTEAVKPGAGPQVLFAAFEKVKPGLAAERHGAVSCGEPA